MQERRRTQEPIKRFCEKNAQADAVGSVVVYHKESSAVHRIRVSKWTAFGWVGR